MSISLNCHVMVIGYKNAALIPNAMSLWLDPYWTGVWLEKGRYVEHNSWSGILFHVSTELQSIAPTVLQRRSEVNRDEEDITLCNSVKMQFFQCCYLETNKEARRDFVFASAFPLQALWQGMGYHAEQYGVFNYNPSEGVECDTLPNIRVLVYNTRPHPSLSGNIHILKLAGPDVEHHIRMRHITFWIQDVLEHRLFPHQKTSWFNLRTYLRDYCSTFFFQDLHQIYRMQNASTTTLPPTVALYALCNALIVNGVCPPDFMTMEKKGDLRLLMRIVRDTLACWTMCTYEGLYWPDKSRNQDVEDQPFPCSFIPTPRVFCKDDCEGRASEAQQMVELLENMHLYSLRCGMDALLTHVLHFSSCTQLLLVTTEQLRALLMGCCHMGALLTSGVLEVQTVVGEANFACLGQLKVGEETASCQNNKEVDGHSFSLLLYHQPEEGKECLVMEDTGWERCMTPSDIPPTHAECNLQKQVALWVHQKKHPYPIVFATQLNRTQENQIYDAVFLGHDYIYFSRDGGCDALRYGAPIKNLMNGICTVGPDLQIEEKATTLRMSTATFLNALGPLPPSVKRLWPEQPGVADIMREYQQVQQSIPRFRRVLMTPAKTEAELNDIMVSSWQPIRENHLPSCTQPNSGVFFSVHKEQLPMYETLLLASSYTMQQHPFMHSVILNVHAKTN